MKLIGLLAISLIWGQFSTQFFFRAWMSLLGLLCCAIGILRNRAAFNRIMVILFSMVSETVFYGLLLILGFYFLYFHQGYGKSRMEVMVFLLSASVRLLMVLPTISKEIDRMWIAVMEPESSGPDNR